VPGGERLAESTKGRQGSARQVRWLSLLGRGWNAMRASAWLLALTALVLPLGAQAADPQIASFVDNPDPVPAGGLYTYTVRVDNNTVDASTNTRLRVVVPAGASFVSAAPAAANCTATNATTVDCNLGTVGALGADPRDVVLTWRALGPGPATVAATATVQADNDTNPDTTNNTQTANTSVVTGANLALAKTDSPDPVVGGANVTYTLTVSNAGPNDAGSLRIEDTLSPSTSFVSASGSGWTCGQASGVVTCTRPGPHTLGAAIPPVSIVARVNAAGGTITNSATVSPGTTGGVPDPDTVNNTATANTEVLPGADIRIAQKTVTSGAPAAAGSNVTFQIQPRNAGPAAATNVVVTDPLPAGWTFVSASGPNWSCSNTGNTVRCTRPTMATTAVDNITIVATAPGNATVGPTGTSYTNTANISSETTDPTAGNNNGSVNINVLPDGADLRLAKNKTPNPVALGSNMTSTITVTNNGPRVATGPLRVVEVLSGETFQSFSGTGWSCAETAPGSGTVVCNHPNASNLAVNASLPVLSLVTTATVAGTVGNTACTGGSLPPGAAAGASALPPVQGDPNPGNDCFTRSSSSTTVRPDLAITKATSTPTGGDKVLSTGEGSVTYTLVVSNASLTPENATGVRIVDTVPGWINGRSSFGAISVTPSAGSSAVLGCTTNTANGTVTCSQSAGTLAQGQSVTVVITVNRPLQDGSFTNTATVSNTVEGDPNANNNSASDTVTVEPIADVQMTGKTATPAAVRAGENVTYVLSYRNNGPSPALGVTVGDAFTFAPGDSGATVVSVASSKAGSSCSIAAGAVLNPASPSFNCTIGTLANGEVQSITLVLRPNFLAGNAGRSFANTARVNTTSVEDPAGGDNGNNERSATLTVNPAQVDLLVNKTDRVGTVNLDPVGFNPGGVTPMGYQVSVSNTGPSFATNVRISENMVPPSGKRVRFVCDTTTFGGSTCNAVPLCSVANVDSAPGVALPTFTCSVPAGTAATGLAVGELAVGATKNIFLRFEVLDSPLPTGDAYNNTATVSANEPDTQTANDSEGESTTTRQRVDLRTTKSASVASPTLMQPFNWIVSVSNGGPGNSLLTELTDTLPAGVQVTGPITWTRTLQAGSGNCTLTGLTVFCNLGQLDATGAATVSIPVRFTSFPSGGTAVNSATVDVDPAKTGGIDTPGGNNTGTSTVNVTRSSLAGTVFEDRDRSGANGGVPQGASAEPRLAGVTITLTGTDAYGNAVNRTTTTDSSGNYSFDNLAPSDGTGYTITQAQPTGFVNGPVAPPAPSAGGSYSAGGGAGNSSFTGIVLATGTSGGNYNFPEVRRPSLAGNVYIDANYSGARDAATDPPIAGATVRLLDANTGAVVATTTTDASGAYSFADLDPFTPYTLEQPLPTTPAGLAQGPVNPGQIGGAACASGCTAQPDAPTAGTDRIGNVDLSSGASGSGFNFGERQLASISGLVWVDGNRDGTLQPGEAGRVAGVQMRLVQGADCTSGTTLQTTSTAADGSWRFDNVEAFRNYLVCETQPTGYGTGSAGGVPGSNQIAINNLGAAGSANNHFGETLGSIAGSVYQDNGGGNAANFNNGVRDAGEVGIAGVPVTLSGTDVFGNAVSVTVNTDASGNYAFDNLFPPGPGGYSVSEGAIPGSAGSFLDGRDSAGTAGGSTAANDVVSGITLAAGQPAGGYLFGELPVATVSGTVYLDRNASGTLDPTPTDGRLPGVTITLRQGTDCTGAVVASTTTDASGNYSFANVPAGGTYTLCQTQPAGYADASTNPGSGGASGAANAITLTNLDSGGSSGHHFGERAASIVGAVYVDFSPTTPANTNNGQRDAGETGIAGVPVTLSGRDINGNPVSLRTLTDAAGNWRFDDLLQSDAAGYTVTEGAIPPAAGSFNDGRDTAGSVAGSTAVNDSIGAIVLAAGVQASGYLFGELPIAPITGSVYLDRNRNGSFDDAPADGPIAGVTVMLRLGSDCTGPVVASTVTDASGNYSFSGASAGLTYTLCQTQPAGYADGGVNPGANGGSAAANAITISNLPAGGSAGNRFAERAGSLAGEVYLDFDNNGARAAGTEAGIAGVTVTLSGRDINGNPVSRSTVTDANGQWRFDDLLAAGPGGYSVTEQAAQPVVGGVATLNGRTTAGSSGTATAVGSTPSAISGIALAAGADSVSHLFGELLPAAIAGTVFIDLNNNGQQDGPGDAGLGGVPIVITGTDDTGAPVTRNLVTAADGRYSVADLRPGSYTVTQPTQPPGTTNGQTVPGSGGGTGSAPTTLPSAISGVTLAPGASTTGNNFAEIPAAGSIAGRVWLDADNDGTIGSGGGGQPPEGGIAGVTIELSGTDTAGRPVSRSTTTDAQGNYSFGELPPGTYTLREPAQPPGTVNGRTVPGSINGVATGSATAPGITPSSISAITLGVNQNASGNHFGELPAAGVSGRVYADNNNNGQVDAGETGLAGVTIVLTGTDDLGNPVNLSVLTAADGSYSFDNLRPGTYTLSQPTQPGGTVNGLTSAGSAGGSASAPSVPVSTISGIVLGPGTRSGGNLFGEIGNSPDLRVSKSAEAEPWTSTKTGRYVLRVRNVGEVATSGVYTVSDRLPAGLTLAATPAGSGWACAGAAGAGSFSCTSSVVLASGATSADTIVAVVNVGAAAATSSPTNNVVLVEGGGEIDARRPSAAERDAFNNNPAALPLCSATIEHNACRTPTRVQLAAALSGTVWFDTGNAPRVLDGGDRRLPGWGVEVVDPASGNVVARTTSANDGSYRVPDLVPGVPYSVRFRDPGSGAVFGYPVNGDTAPGSSGVACDAGAAQAGRASSCVGSGAAPFLSVVLAAGQELAQQSLPVDPSGVVYDSGLRQPVPGSVVTLEPVGACAGWDPAAHIVGAGLGGYSVSGGRVSMTVGAEGFYQYLLTPTAPASCTFGLSVTPPPGYLFQSRAVPPAAGPLAPAGGPGSVFNVQPQAGAPTAPVGSGTTYYLTFTTGSQGPNIIHNHIPLDPDPPTAVALSKSGDKAVAEVGDSVRYSITVRVSAGPRPRQTTVVDRLPAGFTYIRGTASVNDVPIADPAGGLGPTLAFNLGPMPAGNQQVLKYRVRVGVGAMQGDGVNRARGQACGQPDSCVDGGFTPLLGSVATNEAAYRVRVSGGVFATEACVLGKIYVDCNNNHVQDREELGIPGVRLLMSDGTTLVSDSEGKYSVCGLPPKSHVLKADPLTLPRGSRLTTSSNRNLGDAASLWLDLKNGELHRADFIEGSCSNTVLEQVKARRAQGEVRAPETEKKGGPALRFDSKAHGLDTQRSPQQGTDGANQQAPKPRAPQPAPPGRVRDEQNLPTHQLPMNRPPPTGRDSGQAPDEAASGAQGGSDAKR
jgi:large repetitive protein